MKIIYYSRIILKLSEIYTDNRYEESMNEIKMTVKEAIEQLNDLKRDREGFAKNDEPDSVFAYDIKAIDVAIKVMEMIIDEMPTIEAEPIKHGEWIPDDYEYNHCSECSYEHESPEYVTPYCPNCGAKMEE